MKSITYSRKTEVFLECIFYILVFGAIAVFAILQPFGEPPDEINRYKVAQYICVHGKLPIGSDPEISIGGYGASYAFQPILSYIIMGYLMRPFFYFTQNFYILSYIARFVNVIIGVIMAVYVRKLSKEIFDGHLIQWVFTLFIVFLPQNLFLHSYVNTDSMAALSTAIIIYACIRGLKDNWSKRTSITLSIGIILCALSYYNAYSIILCSILLFIFSFLRKENDVFKIELKSLLQKGTFISVIVLIGISWWFLRNAYLYNGDIIGMKARTQCAIETCIPQLNPLTKETIQNTGHPVSYLFRETLFLHTLYESFIATFGTMNIYTYPFIYTAYKFIFAASLLCLLLPPVSKSVTYLKKVPDSSRTFFNILMVFDMVIISSLCIWYSYSWDYQPQGRYVLPLLIPLMYFISIGISKLDAILTAYFPFGRTLGSIMQWAVIIYIIIALTATMLGSVIPHYLATQNWLDSAIESLNK